ncbi:MAG TPA: ATP-dependent Clp protease ATP-binding subunit [Patescibacteria group bacterium]|nr:ATP-dependent Clp protease ATP-binding subunit [Patescibacteria group bacterium]
MLFEPQKPLNILICPVCKSTGQSRFGKCEECRGMSMGHLGREKFLFWGHYLNRYNLSLSKARRIFNKVRFLTVLILWLNTWFWLGLAVYKRDIITPELLIPTNWLTLFSLFTPGQKFVFWLGAWILLYLWYRDIVEKKHTGAVEKFSYDDKKKSPEEELVDTPAWNNWQEVLKLPGSKRKDISKAFTDEALSVLGEAYRLADKNGFSTVEPMHLFYALLSFNRVSNIFIRLGIPASVLQTNLSKVIVKDEKSIVSKDKLAMPLISTALQQVIFQAYEEAYAGKQEYVSVTELLLSTVKETPAIQEMLYDLEIDRRKLENVVTWARIREKMYRDYQKFRTAAGRRSTKGMDKAMTAVQTPYLNQFSEDLTMLAQFGHLETCVARDKEMEEIFRVVDGGGQNVILVGGNGVGKKSIVEGLAQRMVEDNVPHRLQDKRLVRLSVSSLLAGTTPAGAVERLMGIMNDVARAGNIILFIHNIHELTGVSAGGEGGSLDVADSLAESLRNGKFLTIATSSTHEFGQLIANTPLGGVFSKVDIREMDEDQAIQVLESKVGGVEYKQQVFFSYDAVEKAVEFAMRYMHETSLPGSAIEIMREAAVFTRNKKGANALVGKEEVGAVIAEKTGVPVTTVSADESTKLLRLEEEMHKRVIGQEEAVGLVANALRRARAEMRSQNRPMANFLFMGPTGVGKTELAKTIAEVYFGGENRMIRLDMSEFQDKQSVYRLIGAPNEKASGILTEAVKHNPFGILLLDEIEKADHDVLNIFLQVMDDGRLTDSVGEVVDFTNLIIVATSNAGTSYVSEQIKAGLSSEAIKERLLHGELGQYFRPEFLNRFDGIVLFKPLTKEDIKKVAGLMLKKVAKNLEEKGVELKIDDAALEFLAGIGYDPDFGARPMRRAIQERVENKLAELILSGGLKRRDVVKVGENGSIDIVS